MFWFILGIWIVSLIGFWYVFLFCGNGKGVDWKNIDFFVIIVFLGTSLVVSIVAPLAFIMAIYYAVTEDKQDQSTYKVSMNVRKDEEDEEERYQLRDYYADDMFPEFYKEQVYLSWFLAFRRRKSCFEKAMKKYEADPKVSMILEEAYSHLLDIEEPVKQSYESLKKSLALWKNVAENYELEEPLKSSQSQPNCGPWMTWTI